MRQKLLVLVALALAIAQGLPAEPTLPRGDVDGNGQITITDVTQVINMLLHGGDNMVADVNGDGQVTIADVTELISMILYGPEASFTNLSLDFGELYVGQSKLMTFVVKGTSTVGNISVVLQNTSSNAYFNFDPPILPPEGGTVAVTCRATDTGPISGTLLVSGFGYDYRYVYLSGIGVNNPLSVSVSPASLDFGTFIPGDTISREFFVVGTNTVDDISLTLQNTPYYADITISPAVLPPGGGTVTVTCVSSFEGDIFGSLVVSTTGATDNVIGLEGECVEPYISINPNQLDFGEMLVDESKQLTFRVTGTNTVGNISLALQDTCTNADFTISPYPPTLSASGGTVTVTCDAYREGDFSGKIILSSAGANDVTLNLSGTVVGPSISVYPTSLDFGNMYVGQSKEMTFTVEGTNTVGNISLTLPGTSTNADFTVSPEILPSSGGTVTVTCSATGIGDINETLLVSANGVEDETVTLSGTAVLGVPSFMVTPTSLNFGTLKRGEMKSMTFTVKGRNLIGNLSISCDQPDFMVDRTVITPELAASGVTVNVIYNAIKLGDISGTITIAGGGVSSKTVSLTAVCEGNEGDMW